MKLLAFLNSLTSVLLLRQKNHLFTFIGVSACPIVLCRPLKALCCICSCLAASTMATKMKGIYKSFKFISQIFVVKEREMEIGYPTDVKHVAHIGLDAASGSAPSWMNDFKATSEFSTSIGSLAEFRDSSSMALSTWSSHDFDQAMGCQQASDMFKDVPPTDLPNIPKKQKRKKSRSSSSLKSSSSRSSRGSKSKTAFNDMDTI